MARRPDGHETPYVETEALLAVMNRELGDQATFLADLCRGETRRRQRAARASDVP